MPSDAGFAAHYSYYPIRLTCFEPFASSLSIRGLTGYRSNGQRVLFLNVWRVIAEGRKWAWPRRGIGVALAKGVRVVGPWGPVGYQAPTSSPQHANQQGWVVGREGITPTLYSGFSYVSSNARPNKIYLPVRWREA